MKRISQCCSSTGKPSRCGPQVLTGGEIKETYDDSVRTKVKHKREVKIEKRKTHQ